MSFTTPMKFKCKTSGKTYLEVPSDEYLNCRKCAFSSCNSIASLEVILIRHCEAAPCVSHQSYFVRVESDAENV